MKEIGINTRLRETTGKEATRKLRKEGLVPAIVYKKGKETLALIISEVDLIHALHTSAGENVIINLNIKKDSKTEKKTVIIKEIQYHPIKSDIIHVDFSQISLTQNITVKVPVEVKGEPIGVKRDGGILEHVLWEVEVECLPTKIPEKVEIKVDSLEIGNMVHVKDLEVEESVKILNNPEETVLLIEPPKKLEEKAPEEEELVEEKAPEVIGEKEREERAKEKAQVREQQQQQEKKEG